MKGLLGAGLIALGIFVAVLAGYLLNAETVVDCETEWDYVTDIGGAFAGDTSDMDVDYSPTSNITGWSVYDGYNEGFISGVDYSNTTLTNTYRATVGYPERAFYSIEIEATDVSGTVIGPSYSASVTNSADAEVQTFGGDMPDEFGQHTPEAVSVFAYSGAENAGEFGIPMSDLRHIMPGYDDLATVTLTAPTVGSYPVFAFGHFDWSASQYRHNNVLYHVSMTTFVASDVSDTAVLNVVDGTVRMGKAVYQAENVFLVWGQAQFEGTGSSTASVTIEAVAAHSAPYAYLDPAKGVTPLSGSYESTELVYVRTDYSVSPSSAITFTADPLKPEQSCQVDVYLSLEGYASTSLGSFFYAYAGGVSGNSTISFTPAGGSESTFTGGMETVFAYSVSLGDVAFTVDGEEAGTLVLDGTHVATLGYRVTSLGGPLPGCVATATADDGTGETYTFEEEGTWTADLGYGTYTETHTTIPYNTVFWNNNQDNASLTLVLVPNGDAASANLVFVAADGNKQTTVRYQDGRWTLGTHDVGGWPAIQITAGYGKLTVLPVSSFRSFLDYDTVDRPYEIDADGLGTAISTMYVRNPPEEKEDAFRMSVVGTVARIYNGGLFLQNASFSLQDAFPGAQAASVMIGSAAKAGESITFSSGSDSVTLPVDADRLQIMIGGSWRPFNGVTFRWVSVSADTAMIEDTAFAAAIYMNGQTFDAGSIWAQTRDGSMIQIMEAPTGWTLTLDGIWAPTVSYYSGENVASSKVEMADFASGEFQWDKNQFLFVFLGIVLLGAFLGSYFKVVDVWDWMAVLGTVGVVWLLLGR